MTSDLTVAEQAALTSGSDFWHSTPADGSGPVAGLLADPGFMTFLGSLPLSRMAAFPGSPLTAETLEKLVAAVNS